MNLEVDVDLSIIIEEAMETVLAGYDFCKPSSDLLPNIGFQSFSLGDFSSVAQPEGKSLTRKRGVTAVLDIAKASKSKWLFRAEAGAW